MKFLQLSLRMSAKLGGMGGPPAWVMPGRGARLEWRGVYSSWRTDLERTQGELQEKEWKNSRLRLKVVILMTPVTLLSLFTRLSMYCSASDLLTISAYLGI